LILGTLHADARGRQAFFVHAHLSQPGAVAMFAVHRVALPAGAYLPGRAGHPEAGHFPALVHVAIEIRRTIAFRTIGRQAFLSHQHSFGAVLRFDHF
jgi:hypothetical protein